MKYAKSTTVSSENSRAEIERTLRRFGAEGFFYAWEGKQAIVGFAIANRRMKFSLPLPDQNAEEFTHTAHYGYERSKEAALKEWEQACRERWRALALGIKAKLVMVESGITTLEEEFLAHIILPDGKTVGHFMQPQIKTAYDSGRMPKLLPEFT